MINASLQKAIDCLHINDVYIHNSIANCADDFNPKYSDEIESLDLQNKHIVKGFKIAELNEKKLVLQVLIDFGMQWVTTTDKPSVRAIIEADFIVEYLMDEQLDDDCINGYSHLNASYHVWPYWREFLMSQCNRMQLPKIVLPTMQLAHNRHVCNP